MEVDKLCAAFFFGEQDKEQIIIGGESHTVPPGSVLKFVAELDDCFLSNLVSVADHILSVCSRAKQYVTDADVIDAVEAAKAILLLPTPKLLKELILFLPAHFSYADAIRKEASVQFSALELAEFEYEIFKSNLSAHEMEDVAECFYKRRNDMEEYPAITSRWYRWLNYLLADGVSRNLSDEFSVWQDRSEMLLIAEQYSRNLRSLCVEAEKLKAIIPIALGIASNKYLNKTKTIEELIYCTDPPIPLMKENADNLFEDKFNKNERAYAVTTLSALISLEMQLCLDYCLAFRRCKFCGGYFATRNSKAKYCKYPNSEYENQTCQKVAPQVVYWKKNALMKTYRKSYTAYQRWVNRTIAQDESKMYDYMLKLRERLIQEYGESKGRLALQKIKQEIKDIYAQWDKTAKEKLDEFEAGSITEEECRAALVLPRVKDRSPMLASWDDRSVDINEWE